MSTIPPFPEPKASKEYLLRLADELAHDPKELAEHVMLLDLGRNDVGRVSEPGSVQVTQRFFGGAGS